LYSDRPKPSRPSAATGNSVPSHRNLEVSLGLADRMELKETLLSIFRSPQYKPPVLPAVALELTSLTRKSNVSYEDVVHVVEKDPLIVANILKLAQSPLYGGRLRAQSLQDALNRLGINTLRDMVWQVVVGLRIFRAPKYAGTMERLQSHSTLTAYAARLVAAEAGISAEHAFLCGLLHDVGWSGTLVTVSERVPNPPSHEVLFAVIDKMHAEAAAAMGKLWGLSPEIIEVIGNHHERTEPGKIVRPLVPVLCVAEQLADELDFGIEPQSDAMPAGARIDENIVGRFEDAVAALQLQPKLERIRANVAQIAERLRGNAAEAG
jgi:putative nucleotidyltransferase with HDIG domain